jgi:hypothetical protein
MKKKKNKMKTKSTYLSRSRGGGREEGQRMDGRRRDEVSRKEGPRHKEGRRRGGGWREEVLAA